MPNIRQIALDESSPNPYWQTCQTILSLVEMILRLCSVSTKYTVPFTENAFVDILAIKRIKLLLLI